MQIHISAYLVSSSELYQGPWPDDDGHPEIAHFFLHWCNTCGPTSMTVAVAVKHVARSLSLSLSFSLPLCSSLSHLLALSPSLFLAPTLPAFHSLPYALCVSFSPACSFTGSSLSPLLWLASFPSFLSKNRFVYTYTYPIAHTACVMVDREVSKRLQHWVFVYPPRLYTPDLNHEPFWA